MRLFPGDDLKRFTDFWWGDRGLSSLLLLLFLMFFFAPFIRSDLVDILISIFLALLLVSGIANMRGRRIFRACAVLVAGTAMIFSILLQFIPAPAVISLSRLSAIAYFFFLIDVVLRQVFRSGPVTAHRIRGAVAVYLLIGITWSFIYQLIAQFLPGAFSFPQSMTAKPGEEGYQASLTYFSYVTMTTLGYGDIVPVHPVARMFVIVEALIGQLYPATLLARLVSLEIVSRQERDNANP